MKHYKVLLAEDTIEARDTIIEKLKELKDYNFQIDECEFPDKALSKLVESEASNKFYDILFIDLDFTEQSHKGGKRDSGFQIIKRAFDICPISKICTYSGQFKELDLTDEHQELVKKGLVTFSFDKQKKDAGIGDWFSKGMSELLPVLEEEYYQFDVFTNHKAIRQALKKSKLSFQLQWEIISNLDIIIVLLKSLGNVTAKSTFYKLIIQLYHTCLEIFCGANKNEEQIIRLSDENKSRAEKIINKKLELGDRATALRKMVSYSEDEKIKFGYKLNFLRNKSTHLTENFTPDLSNVIFANLCLTLYILGTEQKSEIKLHNIDSLVRLNSMMGYKDLNSLINFIKQ